MTGYYPYHIGMQHGIVNRYQPKYMLKDIETLPEALKKLGYATHMVGKWHLGFCNWNYTPTYRGFDSFYGFYSGAEDYYTHKHYGGFDFRFNKSVHHPPKMRYSTTLFGRRAAEVVPRRYSNQYVHIKNKNRQIYSGWNDVSWHNPDIKMPTLDKMARKGVILNSSYVQPTCSPSRSALMTGYYPYHIGMQHGIVNRYQPKYMPKDKETLPEALKKLGYATHMVGKWHLGFCNWNYTPTYRGFDSFYGFYSGAEDYYTHKHYGGFDFRFNKSVHHPPKMRYSTTLFGRRAAEVVTNHDPDSQPLFLYLSFQGVHSPLQVPRRYSNQYVHIKNKNRQIYSGMVTAMDDAIGHVMSAFRKKNYMGNLLVVFTSDNGGASYIAGSNWPLRGSKATVWEGGTRVPTFIYSKTLLKKTGITHNGLLHITDWLPTLTRIAGGRASPFLDGVDQWLALSRGWPSPRHDFVYNINDVKKTAAIRSGNYKLIVGRPGRYNNWYPAKTKPACNSKEARQGYMYEDRHLKYNDALDRNEQKSVNEWWFTSPMKYIKGFASQAVEVTGASGAWRSVGRWYAKYRCDRFIKAHEREEKSLKPPPIQLFNIKDDPEERYNIASQKPVLLKKMMRKLKAYKKTLVKAQNQPHTKLAHPRNYDDVWSPGWC